MSGLRQHLPFGDVLKHSREGGVLPPLHEGGSSAHLFTSTAPVLLPPWGAVNDAA